MRGGSGAASARARRRDVLADAAEREACAQLLGLAELMSASADSSSRAIARSPREMIPTGAPPSTTGRRRTLALRIAFTASSIVELGSSDTRSVEAISPTVVSSGPRPSAMARTAMSRSVNSPRMSPPSAMMIAPVSLSRIRRAASAIVELDSRVETSLVMISPTLWSCRKRSAILFSSAWGLLGDASDGWKRVGTAPRSWGTRPQPRETRCPGTARVCQTDVPMAKQRQIKMQQRVGSLAAIQQLESRTDEQLLSESKHRAAARAILGARAAERYDAKAARQYFNEALAGAHPQERPALRQMMKASLALAERRPDELRAAVTKLGQEPPSSRQLLMLRLMSLVAPPPGSSILLRIRGYLLLLAIIVVALAIGWGLAMLIALPFGGVSSTIAIFWGLLIVAIALGALAFFGRRRQKRAQAERSARIAGGG